MVWAVALVTIVGMICGTVIHLMHEDVAMHQMELETSRNNLEIARANAEITRNQRR